MQPGGAAQRVGVPGVVAAGGEHAGDVRGGGDAHAGAHVAEIARILEQHHRRRPPVGEHGRGVDGGALGQADHARRGRERRELLEDRSVHWAGQLAHARAHIGGEKRREPLELGRVAAGDLEHVRAEAQRVLERVEAFQHGQRLIAPRAPEARDQRSFLHSAIMAA